MGQCLWEETIFFVEAELKNWTSASRITQILEDTVETWFLGIRWQHLRTSGLLYPQAKHLASSRKKTVSLVVEGTLAKPVDPTLGTDLFVCFSLILEVLKDVKPCPETSPRVKGFIRRDALELATGVTFGGRGVRLER